jgi:hypothetical protein
VKLILENWRKFLLKEEKYKAESGALVYLIKNKLLAVLRSGEFLKNKSFEIEIPDKVKQSRNPTKVLNKINKLVLKIPDYNSKPIGVLGGKFETNGNFFITIGINRDGIKKATVRINEDTIEEIIPELYGTISHELTHGDQGVEATMDVFDVERKTGRTDRSFWSKVGTIKKYLQSEFKRVVFKDNYASEYVKVLESKRQEINYLKSKLPNVYNLVKFIIYFLQPIEIEAYAHGLYAEARKKANVEYRQYRKQFNPTKKLTKDQLTKDYFSKAVMRQREVMLKMRDMLIDDYEPTESEAEAGKVNPIDDKSKQIIDKAIDEFGSKVYDYAFERYPVLTR